MDSLKPLVIRIDEVGRATAVAYDRFAYKPQGPELKYRLTQFVTQHYGRMRATARENYAASLYFLDGRLADATMAANQKSRAIETFLTSGTEEVEVAVKNVALEDLRARPFKATVDFEKVYVSPGDHVERTRERFVAHVVFVVKDRVPNAFIPINPLGLTITPFREDRRSSRRRRAGQCAPSGDARHGGDPARFDGRLRVSPAPSVGAAA